MMLTRPFRKPFWILKSFTQKHQKLIFSAAFFGAVLFIFIKNFLPLLPHFKSDTRIGLVGQYTLNTLPLSIGQKISRGLTKIDPDGQVQPDLAQKWSLSEDETLYEINLKQDIFWSDNTPIKAQDLNFEIPNVQTKLIDDHTISFQLQESYAPFLSLLTRPLFSAQNLGAGKFMIKSKKYSGQYLKSIELTNFKETLFYRFYPSHEAAWLGFRLGEVDQLQNLLINPLTTAWQKKVKLDSQVNYHQYLGIIFNLQNPYLSNKTLRQALAYAIEHKSADPATRALSPINPQSWAFNSKVKPYNFNSNQANELFEKFSTEATISGRLELRLDTSQSFLGLAENIAASWEKVLNIKTKVKVVNNIDPQYQALLIAQEIPQDPDQHALWHSTQNTNITHYSDLKIDKLLEDGRKISDQDKRKEIYQDFQRFLLEDSPAIFLSYPTIYHISRK